MTPEDEKKFDAWVNILMPNFKIYDGSQDCALCGLDPVKFKSFITDLLNKEREEIAVGIENIGKTVAPPEWNDHNVFGFNEAISGAVSIARSRITV